MLLVVGWLVLAWMGSGLVAQSDDAEVLSAAIAHYSVMQRSGTQAPLLIVTAETIQGEHIPLAFFEPAAPEIPSSIVRELHERNATGQLLGGIRLPANAILVPGAIDLTRHVTPTGTEVADWSPFTHAYPGAQLMQLAAPVYFSPGKKALVYFWAGLGPLGTQGWLYILEKQGSEWHVTWSKSPWIA